MVTSSASDLLFDYKTNWVRTVGPWEAGLLKTRSLAIGNTTGEAEIVAHGELKTRPGAVAGMIFLLPNATNHKSKKSVLVENRVILWSIVKQLSMHAMGIWTDGPNKGERITDQEYWNTPDLIGAADEWLILASEVLSLDEINKRSVSHGGAVMTNYELTALIQQTSLNKGLDRSSTNTKI